MTLKVKSLRPRPHLMRFRLNDTYISVRLGLLSTLIRLAFSSKTQRFQIALESGSKFKRVHIVLVWMVENGRNRIKIKTMTKNIAGACNSIIFERFIVDVEKASKRKCRPARVDQCGFRWQRKSNQSMDRALVFEDKARKRDSIN